MKRKLMDFFLVTIGSLISALGFNGMFLGNDIASGGISGLAVSFNALFGWNPADFVMVVNIPLLILCYVCLGRAIFIKTLYGSWIFPFLIKMTTWMPNLTDNQLLAAIFGGIIMGIGLGLVFMGNSSTGGTGIITQVVHKYTPFSLGMIMTVVDGIVVGIGLVAFNPDTVMHSIIALATISYVVNIMLTGSETSRNIMIISRKNSQIKEHIKTIIDRGVTEIPVLGGYSGREQTMLMTTINSHEVPRLQKDITKIDEAAFIVVMPATQVLGRGFSLTKHHQLADEDAILPM